MDQGNEYKHISTAATSVVGLYGQRLTLKTITVNTTSAGTTIIYEGSSSVVTSANIVAQLKPSIAEGCYFYGDHGMVLNGGCTIVTLGATDITAVFSLQ